MVRLEPFFSFPARAVVSLEKDTTYSADGRPYYIRVFLNGREGYLGINYPTQESRDTAYAKLVANIEAELRAESSEGMLQEICRRLSAFESQMTTLNNRQRRILSAVNAAQKLDAEEKGE